MEDNTYPQGFLYLVKQSSSVTCTSALFQWSTNIYRVAPATTTRSASSGPQAQNLKSFPVKKAGTHTEQGPFCADDFNKDCMGEGTDLAQASPFFRRTSAGPQMAALTLQPSDGSTQPSFCWVAGSRGSSSVGGRHSAAQKRNPAPQIAGQCRGR